MSDSIIEQSVGRLFADNVDKNLLEQVESGVFPEALWTLATDSGFDLMLATEEAGGIGEGWAAAYPILRGIGYWQVPLPLAETMIGAMLLSMAGLEVPQGPITLIEAGVDNTVLASGGAVATLSGTAHRVPWARYARWAVVSAGTAGIMLVDLKDTKSVSIKPRLNLAKLAADTVTFDAARALAHAPSPVPEMASPIWTLGAVARSMMMVGALETVLEQSVEYANDRIQFGRPIGKNQAIQQQLALLAGDVACARVAALVAARNTPSPASSGCAQAIFGAATAKIRCGEAATRGAAIVHQVHGAIGFTYEHMLNFSTRRLWAWREEFGSESWWAERLGRASIAARAEGFWPGLVDQRFQHAIQAS